MNKLGWMEYIKGIKNDLKYIQKELEQYSDDVDIGADWNNNLRGCLKSILSKTSENI